MLVLKVSIHWSLFRFVSDLLNLKVRGASRLVRLSICAQDNGH